MTAADQQQIFAVRPGSRVAVSPCGRVAGILPLVAQYQKNDLGKCFDPVRGTAVRLYRGCMGR